MGMDVYGLEPTAEVGTYFRRSVWGWRPLAQYILEQMPAEITRHCEYWQTNDGDGLDATWSVKLADELDAAIENGTAEAYVVMRDATLAALPRERCKYCHGTGARTDEVGIRHGLDKIGGCNACRGKGEVNPPETWYSLELSDIQEFSEFVRASGGFQIY